MKKIIISTIGVLFSFLNITCDKGFLDVAPKDRLSDAVFWRNEADIELALNGCYRHWENYSNIVFLDAGSDNGYEQFNYGFSIIANGRYLPTRGHGTFYDSQVATWFPYHRIRKYNNFLEKSENIEMDQDKLTKYRSEVRFLRAYDYFNKVMFYGDMPLVTEVIQDPAMTSLPRTPKGEIKTFILTELSEIANMLPIQNTIESKGRITQGAALALKARLELYMGKYEEAMASAKAVIDMPVYELFPDYLSMFRTGSESLNKEAILDIQYIRDSYSQNLTQLSLPASEGGWSALNATWDLIEAYQMANGEYINDPGSAYNENDPFKNRDPRLNMTILCPGEYYNGRYYNPLDLFIDGVRNIDHHENAAASRGGLLVKKFVEPVPEAEINNYDANIMVIRLAEMYITFAECAIKTGNEHAKALELINAIRQRAGMPPAEALTEELVRYERRIELAFEGLRYRDIQRWDLGQELLNGPVRGSRFGTVNSETGSINLDDNFIIVDNRVFYPEREYLLPIPQYELDRNENMIQNPGY